MKGDELEAVLSLDEMHYLTGIFGGSPELQGDGLKYELYNSMGNTDTPLFQLGLADELKLEAKYGNHYLVFPLQIEINEFNRFTLELLTPQIYELGDTRRYWRLTPDKELYLVDPKGEKLNYLIKDISASGISLELDNETPPPEQLKDVYLILPDASRLPICGKKTRNIDEHTVAYRLLESCETQMLETLKEFLFQRHKDMHPDSKLPHDL